MWLAKGACGKSPDDLQVILEVSFCLVTPFSVHDMPSVTRLFSFVVFPTEVFCW